MSLGNADALRQALGGLGDSPLQPASKTEGLQTILDTINNILSNPNDPELRRIRKSKLSGDVFLNILLAAGFTQTDEFIEMPASQSVEQLEEMRDIVSAFAVSTGLVPKEAAATGSTNAATVGATAAQPSQQETEKREEAKTKELRERQAPASAPRCMRNRAATQPSGDDNSSWMSWFSGKAKSFLGGMGG
eukprot:GHVU01206933.1.p1 GENE.GHVU01206933.1~~GHVU01206933.1.p1  ORF type:complete len:191 (+),score=35.12 GHVU01206933.1:106-678(+)